MDNSFKLIEEGRKDELWDKHCGYLRLTALISWKLELMLERIKLLGSSRIGKAFVRRITSSIEEFRRVTPLTTYSDYTEFLTNRREADLPVKPFIWARTSGESF